MYSCLFSSYDFFDHNFCAKIRKIVLSIDILEHNLFSNYYRTIGTLNTEKIDSIWDEAKDYVSEAIAAKRNAVQTRIKKV